MIGEGEEGGDRGGEEGRGGDRGGGREGGGREGGIPLPCELSIVAVLIPTM